MHEGRRAALLAVLALLTAPAAARSATGEIVGWIDGDTATVRTAGTVERMRLLGVQAPETRPGERAQRQASDWRIDESEVLRLGRAATAAAARIAPRGARVRLTAGERTHDGHGRALAYLWVGGVLANVELVRLGHALADPRPDSRYADRLAAAEREARTARRGLWSVKR